MEYTVNSVKLRCCLCVCRVILRRVFLRFLMQSLNAP